MTAKEFFLRYTHLIFNTSQAWKHLVEVREGDQPMWRFAYPAIALSCITHFARNCWTGGWPDGLRGGLAVFLILFCSIYLGLLCTRLYARIFLKRSMDTVTAQYFTVYCNAPVFWVSMLEPLADNFFYIGIMKVYAVYVAYIGVYTLWKQDGRPQALFSTATGLTIALLPTLVKYIIGHIMVGLIP